MGTGSQTAYDDEKPSMVAYFFFYQWGTLPALELYTTLERELKEKEAIIETSVDGMDFAAAVYFQCASISISPHRKNAQIHLPVSPAPLFLSPPLSPSPAEMSVDGMDFAPAGYFA